MIDKQTGKKIKKLQKEINKLRKELQKMEFRPCQNDAELLQKEEDLETLWNTISGLEKEKDRYVLQ